MFELSGVNYEEVLAQGDSILVRVIASSSYRGFELSGLYCNLFRKSEVKFIYSAQKVIITIANYINGDVYPPPPPLQYITHTRQSSNISMLHRFFCKNT